VAFSEPREAVVSVATVSSCVNCASAWTGRLPISLARYLPSAAYENVGVTDVVERAFGATTGTVYRYVRRRSRSHEQAEDLTQEVFAAAAAALPSENVGDPPVLAWLYTVAQRRFADEMRRRAHERPVALARAGGRVSAG
jgi:Sigma-70 region 2